MSSILQYAMVALCVLGAAANCHAQQSAHADIQFWYEGGGIAIQTLNGLDVGTGNFRTSGPFQQFENNPGFASETDVGHGVGSGDLIVYNVLDDLQFWNGTTFAPAGSGVQLRIENDQSVDTIVDDTSGTQPGSWQSPYVNLVQPAGSSGDIHAHPFFYLEPLGPTPPTGAYGLKLSLSTSAVGIADSDPFFIVFNFGLDSTAFTTAVNVFADLLTGPLQPGDFNGDGQVNLADYTVWRDNLGGDESLGVLSGNGDGGTVTSTDYDLWKTHFGSGSSGSFEASPVAVPEATSMALAVIGILGLLVFARIRHAALAPLSLITLQALCL